MLNYLVQATEQLASAMIIVGLIFGYLINRFGRRSFHVRWISVAAGVVVSALMAYFKTYTSMVDTGIWNIRIFSISLAAFILFLIFTALHGKLGKIGERLSMLMLGIIMVEQILYALADWFVFPHTIMLTEDSIISSTFLTSMVGVILGLVLTFIAALAAMKGSVRLKPGESLLFMCISIGIISCKQIASTFSIMLAKQIISSNHTLFTIAKYASNYSLWFIYAQLLLVLIIAVMLQVRKKKQNEPYRNNAEFRKIKAKWRTIARWNGCFVVCAVLVVCTLTAVNAYVNQEVELSPIEDASMVDDENIYISFDLVNDGSLHRFGYETENGTVIRLIVIQKPDSSAYGIGLDACEICGETGYYENSSGEVVCNLCDVVMNINTIGFQGGCNPIVIDYSIANGYIIVPIEGLLEYESEFD